MGQPFNTVQLSAPPQASDINRIQANISSAFNSVSGPFIGGNLLTGISLTASTPKAINHGLGRTPIVWTLGDLTASATVYRTAWDSNSITLEASANCTVAIWVN